MYKDAMDVFLIKSDITELDVECIVNPANSSLILGGGLAGTILSKGGNSIQKECNKIACCPVGKAVITGGGDLKAKYVIHTVGPRYNIDKEPQKLLYEAIKNSILLAEKNGISSIAMPAVSTGIFGYPIDEAAGIILSAVEDCSKLALKNLKKCYITLYSDKDFQIFSENFKKINT